MDSNSLPNDGDNALDVATPHTTLEENEISQAMKVIEAKQADLSGDYIPIGLEVSRTDVPSSADGSDDNNGVSEHFVSQIMHRVVSTKLYCSTVLVDVEAENLAKNLGLSAKALEELDQAPLPRKNRRSTQPSRQRKRITMNQRQADGTSGKNLDNSTESIDESLVTDSRFAELFEKPKEVTKEVEGFASQLIARLDLLVSPKQRPANKRKRTATESDICNNDDGSADSGAESDEDQCGFSSSGHHPDIKVLCDGYAIVKTGAGLYRTAKGASDLSNDAVEMNSGPYSYFEVYVVEDCGKDGMCIGVATEDLALNKLVGSNASSVGLHSSGNIVSKQGTFEAYGEPFRAGDRVGCLVRRLGGDLPPNSLIGSAAASASGSSGFLDASKEASSTSIEVTFTVNGRQLPTIHTSIDASESSEGCSPLLFPAVSLYQKESKAVLCCCRKDWKNVPEVFKSKKVRVSGNSDHCGLSFCSA